MVAIAAAVQSRGFTVTHKWWETEDIKDEDRTPEFNRERAMEDIIGVRDANLVLLINSSKSEGKAVEQGVAIQLDKPIIAVGKLGEHSKNVFHYLSQYRWVDNLEEAYKVLESIKWLVDNGA